MINITETPEARTVEHDATAGLGSCLVVADRGHVWAARNVQLDEDFVRLTQGQAVRRWGTSEGLNELANKGPLPNTRLDAAADLLVSRKALIAIIPCEVSKWPG